ncbi:methionine aminopeptidase 1B, chloroplastic [Tanacetum coccineum]|uniref:Methionine aminopeptidase 1B, chloroplastic n=1 Tax=Tanacetum coccineum TaxID=301880 RepID=A0ABQ4WWR2_9ASTR
MPTKVELTLEQSQQGVSDDVLVTEERLERGIAVCKDGALFRKIRKRISEHAEKFGYAIVDRFVGHGVGTVFHSEPLIFHHRNEKPGSMVAEPILTLGTTECVTWEDNWTTLTKDGSPAAQFEQTILITKTGVEILTKLEDSEEALYCLNFILVWRRRALVRHSILETRIKILNDIAAENNGVVKLDDSSPVLKQGEGESKTNVNKTISGVLADDFDDALSFTKSKKGTKKYQNDKDTA